MSKKQLRKTLYQEGVNITSTGWTRSDNRQTGSNNYITQDGDRLFVDASSGDITIEFHTNPHIGDSVWVYDVKNTFTTHTVSIDSGTENIDSVNSILELNKKGISCQFIYVDDTIGWHYIDTSQSTIETNSIIPVVFDGTTYVSAKADIDLNLADLVKLSDGTFLKSGKVTWTGHGLTVGAWYYLSVDIAGAYIVGKPTNIGGWSQQLFFVEDVDTIHIDIQEATKVQASGQDLIQYVADNAELATITPEAGIIYTVKDFNGTGKNKSYTWDGSEYQALDDVLSGNSTSSSGILLYPTSTTSDITGYNWLVDSQLDATYDTTAIDIPVPATGSLSDASSDDGVQTQLVGEMTTIAGILVGSTVPGNITITGNIRRQNDADDTGNPNNYAKFYFKVFKRNNLNVETLLATSSKTSNVQAYNRPVDGYSYEEFSESALLPATDLVITDRIVIKFYADTSEAGINKVAYEFQFGGDNPVRAEMPGVVTEASTITTVTTATTLAEHRYVAVNNGATALTITLPTAVGITGRKYDIKRLGAANVTVAATSPQTIDGATTYVISTQYNTVSVISDGANWLIF